MNYKNFLIILLILMCTLNVASAEWFNSTGTDHSGATWTPADASSISGRHYNISTFTITNGYTVNIDTGIELEVFAETIHVYGTIDGDGHGASGTGNGGAGGADSSGAGGGGGAGYGGNGAIGKPGDFGAAGSAGSLFGDNTTKIISMGSTGGTGGTNSGSSGTGGLGGASVLLYGDTVIVSGTITCDGIVGVAPGEGGGGGGGSGGGILIVGVDVVVNGTLSADGGDGGNSGSDGDGAGGGGAGGRIKLVSPNLLDNWNFEDWSAGASSAPDGWTAVNNPTIAREGTIIKTGTYSVKLTATHTSSKLSQTIPNYIDYRGLNVVFGCWVYSSTANRARILLEDNTGYVFSDYHTGSGTWEFLTATKSIDSSATHIIVSIFPDRNTASDFAYFDGSVLVLGDSIQGEYVGVDTVGISTSVLKGSGGTGTTGVADGGVNGTYDIFNTSPPYTPTVITPPNNSDQGSSPVTLNVTTTDIDGDSIQYYYYGDAGAGSTYLQNSSSYYGWSIGSNTYLWKARAHDGFMYSPYISIQTFTSFVPPVLYTPSNTSTQYTTFPPLLDSVSFTWQDLGASQYRVMVAEDVNFNVMAVDTHVGTNNSNHDLLVNKEYFWKVYAYDGSSYSGASPIYQFNLTGNSTLSGSAIEGVCYSDIDGTYTALPGTEVTIWNETWSDTVITGSNGYYLFTDVTDGNVYNVQAKKDLYLDSSVALVNATSDPVTENFYLLPDRTSEEWRHYVKFIVWGPAGYYEGVTVTVYKNSDVTALYTADTGNDGAATFIMDRQQQYRVTAIDASQGINRSMTLYPKDEKYLFFVASTTSWTEHAEPQSEVIDIEISTKEINSTHAYINISYADSLAETTQWTLYLNQSNISNPHTQDTLQSTSDTTSTWTHSFIVSEYKGQGYWVNVRGVHTTYGNINEQFSVQFEDEIGIPGIPAKVWLYVAVLVMMFTGGMFGASTAPQGAMIICVEGWIFLFFGWFASIDNNGIIAVGLGAATVVAIIANINQYSKKEGHE